MDYLVIGNITLDKIASGYQIGGTAAYAARTAQALGLKTGILTTAAENELDFSIFRNISLFIKPSGQTTVFENRKNAQYREQMIHHWAGPVSLDYLPADWTAPHIVHFGPVAGEIDPEWVSRFSTSYTGFTPQGMMRSWDKTGHVKKEPFILSGEIAHQFNAIVFSIEDVAEDEDIIEAYAQNAQVLAVTEGKSGVRIYWHGDMRHFSAPDVMEISDTGAGDIFATAFFYRHQQTKDPWEAARFATQLAALSVTRSGLESVPTVDEIKNQTIEIL